MFSTGDRQWYLVIGDVSGKGAEAAAVTALARYTLRTAAARRRSPAEILRWVDEAMVGQDAGGALLHDRVRAHRPGVLAGAADGVLRRTPAPGPAAPDGEVEQVGAYGTLLGLGGETVLQDRSTDLRPGDALVLYTDGLTEAQAPKSMWGPEELAAAVRAAPLDGPTGLVESLVASALGERTDPRDDLAVLVLKLTR